MSPFDVQRNKSMLEAILESAAGAIIAIDADGVIQSVNPATEKLFGYTPPELLGQNVKILMPEPDASRHDGYLSHHLSTGEKRIIGVGREVEGRRKDGTIFPIHLSVSAFDVDGRKFFAGIIHDLSARTRLEAEIDRQALLFQTVFDHVPEALLIADPDLRILLMNPAARRALGYTDDDLAGEILSVIYDDPSEFARMRERLDALDEAGQPSTAPVAARLRCADGRNIPGEIVGSVIRSASGYRTGVVMLVRDLTEDVKREQALLKSQRLEAIGQLTGGVAHDFNNLLTIVTGNLELLEPFVDDERARDHMRRAAKAADAGARLTGRLLTFARRRHLEPEVVNLNDQVRVMTELLQRTLGESIHLTTTLAPNLWTTRIDPSETENAILNLAINARDAMPNGGKLILETSNATFDHRDAGPEAGVAPGDYVRLSVSDSGTGMTKDVLSRAFEPFFTTKPQGRGTGLGLSTIYGFVKQSNGNVTIYSELGKGTTINLYLPRYQAEVPRDEPQEQTPPAANASGETILIVEDNPEVRAVGVSHLERLGYRVIETTTASEAIEKLRNGLAVNAVFSDVVMPGGLSGFDLARWINANRPELPVLLTSGFAEDIARGNETGMPPPTILRKPYAQADLARSLRETIAAAGRKS
jgi:PAS domain S-box-containing protein